MRLLKLGDDSELSLTSFSSDVDIPQYAILSHTWGLDGDEVTFKDISAGTARSKAGYTKIKFCGEKATKEGLRYFWVDTCCIDKTNSTELQEAITSMFRWYRNATKCYVYLSDVSTNDHDLVDQPLQSWQLAFRRSRWFTRGWTLQELIAPRSVEFFSSDGNRIGDRQSLEQQLYEITGIAIPALRGKSLSAFSVSERMSWAKKRKTKCEEDMAYSLLGIFDISMPLIYGEGEQKAFSRLEEEICKHGSKRYRHETSQAFLSHTKRLKTSHDQPFSDTSFHNVHPEPLSPSVESTQGIDAATKQSLIKQLYFTKIDERLTSLAAAQGKTCQWFLTKPEYISWNDLAKQLDHGGFLWIKGNPGTGKSTLMKLLFEKAKDNAKRNPTQITLSFFFLARGTAEEKSTTGLYRSLLHQLFEKAVDLKETLDWMTTDGARGILRNGWNEEPLKQTMMHAIQNLGSRSLMIFVDALDECNAKQTAGMVSFFEDLCNHAQESQVWLQICFSSRYYPIITIQKGIEVTLEDEIGHTEDIQQYIKSKLRVGKPDQNELLRSDILQKSSGIFLWVVLVISILNSEYRDNSGSIEKTRDRLKDIPPKLTDLFELILTRDGENLERLQVCLQWILFAARPLKPQELYFAIQVKFDRECSGRWDQEDVELDQMKTFVRSSSKGLAEVTRNNASEVQFIHESVRDFLLGKYGAQWSGISGNFVGHSHETLRDCCLAQLNDSLAKDVELLYPLPVFSKRTPLGKSINLKFPFLEYSVFNVLHHANIAQQNAIAQGGFLDTFPLQRWIFLHTSLEMFDVPRYTKSASLLYILAEENLADLIRIHPRREFSFDVEDERYGLPMFAALAVKSDEAVRTFLEVQMENQPLSSSIRNLWKQYCYGGHPRRIFRREFTFSQQRSIASYLTEHGQEFIAFYLQKAFYPQRVDDLNSKDKHGQTLIIWAASRGYDVVTKLLLTRDIVDVNSKDEYGRSPLFWAALSRNEVMVKLLLTREDIDVNSQDNNGYTPLSWVASTRCQDVVKLLVRRGGISVNLKGKHGQSPLSSVGLSRNEAIVKLLLTREDIDVNLQDKHGRSPLSWAVSRGDEAVVKVILEREDVDMNSKDSHGRSPLFWAASRGDEALTKLLLAKGGIDETLT